MNARIFRLVFDRLRNTLVPVSEAARMRIGSITTRGQRRALSRAGAGRAAQAKTVSVMLAMGLAHSCLLYTSDAADE